jgi:hypothetical protein
MPSNPLKSPSTPILSGYLSRSPFESSNLLDRPVFSSPRQYPPDLFDDSDDEEGYGGEETDEQGRLGAEQGYSRLGSFTKDHPIGPGQFSPFLLYTSSQPLRRSPTPAGTNVRQRAIYHDPVPTLVMSDSTHLTESLPTPAASMMTSNDRGPSSQHQDSRKRSKSKRATRGLIRLADHPELYIPSSEQDGKKPTDNAANWRTRLGLDRTPLSNSIPIDEGDDDAELSTVREEMTRCWVSSSMAEEGPSEWSDVETIIPFHPADGFDEDIRRRDAEVVAVIAGRGRRRGR